MVAEEEQGGEREQKGGRGDREGAHERRGARPHLRPGRPAVPGPRRQGVVGDLGELHCQGPHQGHGHWGRALGSV